MTSQKTRRKLALNAFAIVFWTGVSVIASQLIVGWVMMWIMGTDDFLKPTSQAIYSALTYILALLMAVWIPSNLSFQRKTEGDGFESLRIKRKDTPSVSRRDMGLNGLPTWTDIGLGPIGFVVSTILAAALVSLFSMLPWFNASETQSLVFSVHVGGVDRLVAFLTLVVVAPIAEELIFRGWLYGKLRKDSSRLMTNTTSMVVSSLLTSVLFGVVHLQWNVGVNVFALSMILCAMREITGTIYAGMMTHMIKNGVAFYLLFVVGMG